MGAKGYVMKKQTSVLTDPPSRHCSRSGSVMEAGFILAVGAEEDRQSRWVEGKPEYSFWHGLNINNRRQFPVITYCCEQCGFLESYAQLPNAPAKTLLRPARAVENSPADQLLRSSVQEQADS